MGHCAAIDTENAAMTVITTKIVRCITLSLVQISLVRILVNLQWTVIGRPTC